MIAIPSIGETVQLRAAARRSAVVLGLFAFAVAEGAAQQCPDASPPPCAPADSMATVGARSQAAYREYVIGVRALNHWDLDSARARLLRAVDLDSTFALAHYRLSVGHKWPRPNLAEQRRYAEAAGRFSSGLPARERTLIAARLDEVVGLWVAACEKYAGLIRDDSGDVEAWFQLGECNALDRTLVPLGGDTTRFVLRGNWNVALRAFARTLELDSSYHAAFVSMEELLRLGIFRGCLASAPTRCYTGYVRRLGDTLVTETSTADPRSRSQSDVEAWQRDSRANASLARDIAAQWAAAAPRLAQAHDIYARRLEQTGDTAAALRESEVAIRLDSNCASAHIELSALHLRAGRLLEAIPHLAAAQRLGDRTSTAAYVGPYRVGEVVAIQRAEDPAAVTGVHAAFFRAEALLAIDSGEAAARLADSLLADPLRQGIERVSPGARRILAATFARFSRIAPDDSSLAGLRGTERALVTITSGALPPGLDSVERRLLTAAAGTDDRARSAATWLDIITILGFRARGWGPSLRATSQNPDVLLLALIAARDTAGAREHLAERDAYQRRPDAIPTTPHFAPEMHLLLGDTAGALAGLLEFERLQPTLPLDPRGIAGHLWTLGRTWLMTGDLAAATGHRDAALRAYRRVVAMWSGGDPEVQPAVARARAALDRLERGTGVPGVGLPAAAPAEAITLRPALPEGTVSRSRQDVEVSMVVALPAQPSSVRRVVARNTIFSTTGVTSVADGGLETTGTVDSVRISSPAQGQPGAERLQAEIARLQERLLGMATTLRTDSDGAVVEVRRLARDGAAPAGIDLRSALGGGIDAGLLVLPLVRRAIRIGDTWRDPIQLVGVATPGGAPMTVTSTYRLERIVREGDARLAEVSMEGTTSGPLPSENSGAIAVSFTGSAVLDLATGALLRRASSTRVELQSSGGPIVQFRVLSTTALR